ncbi:MAG: prolipoprotein diacylglyceryl transferase [Clostridia bacterium]|nr:prolipoprotein diacylglyceryl transferase [Clostridia bacterium]
MLNTVAFPGLFDRVLILNRVAFTLFGNDIMWYGVIIGTGFLLAGLYGAARAEEFRLDADFILDLLIFCLPAAIVGARLYYVAFRWDYYAGNWSEILNIRGGGLAFYGGFLGAILMGALVCFIKKRPFLAALDIACICFPMAQAIGRWGNFVNCEAFGGETSLPWGMSINGGAPVHPTFLYESLWNIIGFALLHFYSKKRKFDGEMAFGYLAWYGFGRMIIEGLRTDSLYIGSTNLRASQVLALVFFLVGSIMLLYMHTTKKYRTCPIFKAIGTTAEVVIPDLDEVLSFDAASADIEQITPEIKEETEMKELTLFMLPRCPHCKLAFKFQEELMAEHPEYQNIKITMIDEAKEAALAEQYDYYYVPSYFVGKEKLFEGHAEKADVEAVFKKVLEM